MFDWLEDELRQIKTRKFHLTDSPVSAKVKRAMKSAYASLPPAYQQFALRFGNAELYRYGTNYYVTIFAVPKEPVSGDVEGFWQFGRTWTSNAYFRESLLAPGSDSDSPVFESYAGSFRQTAAGFAEWLPAKCAAARKRFKKKEWEAVLKGPPPFSAEEHEIVGARKEFRWRVVGVARNGDLKFEVRNGSKLVLPYLSLGIRGSEDAADDELVEGGVYLPVANIAPSEKRVIEFDCYKDFIAPDRVEVFDLPDPEPEDREQYWEFRAR